MTKSLYWLFKKFPEEANLIARMIAGYGEMEFTMSWCVTHIIDDEDTAFKVIFRAGGEVQRILMADALARLKISEPKESTLFQQAIAGMHECRKIRNQYAHSHWRDLDDHIGFMNFDDIANQHTPLISSKAEPRHLNLALLQRQEAYFFYVYETFNYISFQYQVRQGGIQSNPISKAPRSISPPNLYNLSAI